MESPKSEEILVEEAFSYILTPEKELLFCIIHDPKTHYMEIFYN
jgi:hypothetical protein